MEHGDHDDDFFLASEVNRIRESLEPGTTDVGAKNLILARALEDAVVGRVKFSGKLQAEPRPLLFVPPDCRIDVEAGLWLQEEPEISHRIS